MTEAGLLALEGKRITINIMEPSEYVHRRMNRQSGTARRVLRASPESGDWDTVIVELNGTLKWMESEFRIISLSRRFARDPLSALVAGKEIVVNINREDEWILDCAKNDPRIGASVGSRHIGFGSVVLTEG
ncbi:MAG TPA: hypothetical protein VGR51_00485 [Thermoplasmata archaeon]|jgi:hypothetical protein|nr:hypothetical protein [Thermoplasmata archaeon]